MVLGQNHTFGTKRLQPHHCRFFVNLGSLRHQDVVWIRAGCAGKFSNVHEIQCRIIFKGEMFINWEISHLLRRNQLVILDGTGVQLVI